MYRNSLSDLDIKLLKLFKQPMVEEPETDYFIEYILDVFAKAGRGRGYYGGMSPMPLTVGNISEVVNVYPSMISREILDDCIFALDNEWIKEYGKPSDKPDGGD